MDPRFFGRHARVTPACHTNTCDRRRSSPCKVSKVCRARDGFFYRRAFSLYDGKMAETLRIATHCHGQNIPTGFPYYPTCTRDNLLMENWSDPESSAFSRTVITSRSLYSFSAGESRATRRVQRTQTRPV